MHKTSPYCLLIGLTQFTFFISFKLRQTNYVLNSDICRYLFQYIDLHNVRNGFLFIILFVFDFISD